MRSPLVLSFCVWFGTSCSVDRRSVQDGDFNAIDQLGASVDVGNKPNPSDAADVRDAQVARKDFGVGTRDAHRLGDRTAPSLDATPPQGGLVLHWAFDEDSGMVASDLSGSHLDGVLEAAGGGPLPGWTPGRKGRALEFNHLIDNVTFQVQDVVLPQLKANGLLDVGLADDLTISLWVNLEGNNVVGNNSMWIVGKKSHSPDAFAGAGYGLLLGYDSQLWALFGDGQRNLWMTTDRVIGKGTGWHHVALVFDHRSLAGCRVHADGEEVDVTFVERYVENGAGRTRPTTVIPGSLETVVPFKVGRHPDHDAYFNGMIDEIRIYKRALSASEVEALYQSP